MSAEIENRIDETPPISAFDMRPTIQWYLDNRGILSQKLPQQSELFARLVKLEEPLLREFPPARIGAVLRCFPQEARVRSIVRAIAIKPPLWFKKGTTRVNIMTTPNQEEALRHCNKITYESEMPIHPALLRYASLTCDQHVRSLCLAWRATGHS